MSSFDIVEIGYNVADETVNFGTRCMADGDNLYEASTLATIKCSTEPKPNSSPYINAIIKNGFIFFNIDNSMRIFKDVQCSEIIFNVNFDSVIDTFCLSSNGDLLLICLRDGTIHLVDCNNEYQVIYTTSLAEDSNKNDICGHYFVNSFLEDATDCSFLIVTKLGEVFRISTQIKTEIQVVNVNEFHFQVEVASFYHPFLIVDGAKLAVLDLVYNDVISSNSCNIVKLFPLNHMFLALNGENSLLKICAKTLLVFPVSYCKTVKNLLFLSFDDQRQMIAVTEEESKTFIELISYPELTTIYSLKVTNEIELITPESLHDEILFVSKISNETCIDELRFHVVYETEPEQRLQRLLKKQKYEEAEKFANLFHLDITIINKAKAQVIVDKTICNSEDVQNLIDLLDVIDDDEFKLQCCLDIQTCCNEFEDIRRILDYGCKIVPKKQHKDRIVIENLQKSVIDLMSKCHAFMALDRENDYQMQAWLRFSDCDLITKLKLFLRNYQIEEAKIVYSRLYNLCTEEVTESQIDDILNVLNKIPMDIYLPFLPIFIPITLRVLPSTLSLFVKWIYNGVCHLEKRCAVDFPDNAIKFTENIIGLIKVGDVGDISFQRQCMLDSENLTELSKLLSILKSLNTLKNNYCISIPVKSYVPGPQNVVRILLNIEMSPHEYDDFLKKFLLKFILENHLEPNEIFLNEVKNLMNYEEKYWVNIIESILNCISSVQIKLEAVLEILDFAIVPWSDTVKRIAHNTLKYSHPLVQDIKELIQDEPVQIVLRKPKYRIKEKQINDIKDLKFVSQRIIYCKEETMVNDVYQICKTPKDRHIVNMLLIKHFIYNSCLEKALEILDNNTPEEILNCCEELIAEAESAINGEVKFVDDLEHKYYDILGPIFKRLNNGIDDEFARICNEETLDLLRNVYNVRKNFQIETTSFNLRRSWNKNKIVDDILEDASSKFTSGKQTIDEVFTICQKISKSLSLNHNDVLIKFCEKTGDFNIIYKTAENIYKTESSTKNLCLIVVLLLQYVGTYKLKLAEESCSDSESLILSDTDCIDNDVFCEGLQLAEKIIAKAVCEAEAGDISACVEIIHWVNTCFYFIRNQDNVIKKLLFEDMFDTSSVLLGFSTFSCIRSVFNAFCNFIGQFNDPHMQYLSYFQRESLTEVELFKEIKVLPHTLENLCKEGQNFTAFKIVETLQNCLVHVSTLNPDIITFLNNVLKKICIPKLLSAILGNSVVDVDLLYNLLLSCDVDDMAKFIRDNLRMFRRYPKKFKCVAQTGVKFWDYHKLTVGKPEMMNILVTLKWWKKFDKKKLDYDNFFKIRADQRLQLLIDLDYLDMKSIEEFCRDYDLELYPSYLLLFKKTLSNWRLDYEIKCDALNKKYLDAKNSENELLIKCKQIMEVIEAPDVIEIITKVWTSINIYHYEVFLTMLRIMEEIDPKQDNTRKIGMLQFLKNYQRVSKPSEAETEQWYTIFPGSRSIDVLSEFRLPFTPFLFTDKIWDIIRPEINIKTYRSWFNAIDLMKEFLNKNDICSFVVKEVVASNILLKDVTEQWVLYPKHDDLFTQIDQCVMEITDLERATSAMYHLMTHTPNGADQVHAATLCYKYAVKYKKENAGSSDVEKAFIKVQKKYYNLATINILHLYQLAEEKYINFVTNPNDLILALYLDERIVRNTKCVDFHCPDINKATEKIAKLFNLDITKIRNALVNNWLSDSPGSNFDFDSSIIYTQNNSTCDEDNLKRAAYICYNCDIELWRTHLFKMGLDCESEEQKSVTCKARALKVCAMISDAETITKLTELTYNEFMFLIDKLTIISNLQYLGFGLEMESFDTYGKRELLKRLVSKAGNLLAIKTMAAICMTYTIYDLNYWEFIINKAIKFSMFVELNSYVHFLKTGKCQYKSFYINAWQKLIDYSFGSVNTQNEDVLIKNFLMIQSCPVLYKLNFENLFKKCMELGKFEFAAVLLQYFEGEKRTKFAKGITNSTTDLKVRLDELQQSGLWGIPYVQEILKGAQES